MIAVLVDTSVSVSHFKRHNDELARLLAHERVLMHPPVLGEIACGTPFDRLATLADLGSLRQARLARQATLDEVLQLVERERGFGLGFGLADLMLLASTLLMPQEKLWTLHQRLQALAERFATAHL